jgi:hypothetical protein
MLGKVTLFAGLTGPFSVAVPDSNQAFTTGALMLLQEFFALAGGTMGPVPRLKASKKMAVARIISVIGSFPGLFFFVNIIII